MSFADGIKKKIEEHLLEQAIEQLGSKGVTGVAELGQLRYDYPENSIKMFPNQEVLDKVRREWEKNHLDKNNGQ